MRVPCGKSLGLTPSSVTSLRPVPTTSASLSGEKWRYIQHYYFLPFYLFVSWVSGDFTFSRILRFFIEGGRRICLRAAKFSLITQQKHKWWNSFCISVFNLFFQCELCIFQFIVAFVCVVCRMVGKSSSRMRATQLVLIPSNSALGSTVSFWQRLPPTVWFFISYFNQKSNYCKASTRHRFSQHLHHCSVYISKQYFKSCVQFHSVNIFIIILCLFIKVPFPFWLTANPELGVAKPSKLTVIFLHNEIFN